MWNYRFFCFNRVNRKEIKFNGQKLHRNEKSGWYCSKGEKNEIGTCTLYHEIWKKCKLTK